MSDSEDERLESPPPVESPAANDDDDTGLNGSISGDDDLFGGGDGSDEGQLSDAVLSDHDLNEDDDDGDDDDERRRYDDEDTQQVTKEELVMDVDVFRHRVPKSTDKSLKSLRIPPFIKMNPEEYHADTYEPSEFDLENSLAKNPKSVARFRRDPSSGNLQSNAALYRWSDGSLTLAIGDEHFEVLTKSLAPAPNTKYHELQDAHYYAAAAHLSSSLLLTVGHVSHQYSVRANRTVADDALKRLTDRLHAASQTSNSGANMIIRTVRDPELAKKEAELAEKERERARRRRETAAARLDGLSGGGGGGRSGRSGGALSINDLEGGGGRRSGGSRKRGLPGAGRAKRRRPEYDSDDELPQGARRNDDYDKEDAFIAPSDEDMSDEEEEDDDEELLDDDDDDDDDDRGRRTKRQKTVEDDDADGDADPDEAAPVRSAGRNRRHNIIDDDEEDDE